MQVNPLDDQLDLKPTLSGFEGSECSACVGSGLTGQIQIARRNLQSLGQDHGPPDSVAQFPARSHAADRSAASASEV